MSRGGQTYYYFYDALGSVRQLTNATGTVVESYDYDVYGRPLNTSTVGNPVMFTGRWYDAESTNYYYRARYYSPMLGRFLQRDPVGYTINGLNLYIYTLNNPINFTDPLGLYKYETTNVGIAFIHESNPFNVDSAMHQQMQSWGKFYAGDWAGAAALSGQSMVEKTNVGNNSCEENSAWQNAYNVAQIVAGGAAVGAIGYDVALPYWRYVGPNSNPASRWLTRGWKPPYGRDFNLAKSKLQLPNTPNDIVRVKVNPFRPITGPKTVRGNPQWGEGGGQEWYRDIRFPKNTTAVYER